MWGENTPLAPPLRGTYRAPIYICRIYRSSFLAATFNAEIETPSSESSTTALTIEAHPFNSRHPWQPLSIFSVTVQGLETKSTCARLNCRVLHIGFMKYLAYPVKAKVRKKDRMEMRYGIARSSNICVQMRSICFKKQHVLGEARCIKLFIVF
jgi:hypothetical protein